MSPFATEPRLRNSGLRSIRDGQRRRQLMKEVIQNGLVKNPGWEYTSKIPHKHVIA